MTIMPPQVAVLLMWYTGLCSMMRLPLRLSSRNRPAVCKSCLQRVLYRELAPLQGLLLIRHRHGQLLLSPHLEEHRLSLHPMCLRRQTFPVISVAAGYKTLRV